MTAVATQPKKQAEVTPVERTRLDAGLNFIRQRFADGITLRQIAKPAGLSPFHFHRRFTFCFGFTPKAEVTRLQIGKAQKLMKAGTALFDVATQCGFAHQSHFTSRFKQATKLTPTQWLKTERQRAD